MTIYTEHGKPYYRAVFKYHNDAGKETIACYGLHLEPKKAQTYIKGVLKAQDTLLGSSKHYSHRPSPFKTNAGYNVYYYGWVVEAWTERFGPATIVPGTKIEVPL